MDHSGLAGVITKWFVDIANVHTFPLLAFLSSAVINFAVPSGGGHWVVQGPFVMPAAQALGVDLGKSAMAIAYGKAWTNMAQPFWALPALAIAGLGVRHIMGYCVTALLFSGVVFVAGIYLFCLENPRVTYPIIQFAHSWRLLRRSEALRIPGAPSCIRSW
jgi:short-chain fatty acids transporter